MGPGVGLALGAVAGGATGRLGIPVGGVGRGAAVCVAGTGIEVTVDASRALCETTGESVTGTLLKALRNASAVWKRSAGSLAIDIRIISFIAAGRPGCSSTGG